MYRVFYCVTVEHDLRLVAVAALLCALSAFAAVGMARRGQSAPDDRQSLWLIVTGFVTGVGIWGTHFVSMLAYEAPVPVEYGLFGTVGSLLLAIFVTSCGWTYAVRMPQAYGAPLGGAVVGAGIATMHFMGIDAMNVGANIVWDAPLVLASIGAGMLFAASSATVLVRVRSLAGLAGAGALLVLGVVSLHFTAMSAMQLVPSVPGVLYDAAVSSKLLAITVALAVVFVISVGLAAAALDVILGARRQAEALRLQALADATFEGIAVVRDGLVREVNEPLCDMLSLRRADLLDMPVSKLALDAAAMSALADIDDTRPVTCRLRGRNGGGLTVQVRARKIDFNGEASDVLVFRDVSAEERARARMTHLAHHDTLTGLPNRLRFREALDDAIEQAWQNDTMVAVVIFDLDRFKEVNDVHGHATGDALLKAVAERMLDTLPDKAIPARLSGDEFAVVLPDVSGHDEVLGTAQRVVDHIGVPVVIDQLTLNVSASGGATVFPLDGEDPDRLMNQADLALYHAKGQGRNQVRGFDPQLGRMLQERRLLEADLAMAIEDELLELHFQPQVRLGDGEIVGYEALVRWNDEKRGYVSPAEFVQIAEETGQILKMGEWVIRAACREAVGWPEDRRVAVNVSPAQFRQGNLVLSVQQALRASGLEPGRLVVEITEGVLIDDEDRALQVMRALKDLGVRLAIDDFGTGYSSLAYLRTFPFDKIKIDRSFITGIEDDREAQIIVQATIDLARALGISVVVEGVETFGELAALGCQPDLVLQGFLVSRPVSRGHVPGFDSFSAEQRQAIADQVNGGSGDLLRDRA
ncbi:EAL domain-containing protein [Maricaulis sp.]|uniref:bifunctional diguanylate cyclase/phosphodiesterase n=1 Tax=Maricaulis sp. TaxID=1486257 RepID=UPI0032968054